MPEEADVAARDRAIAAVTSRLGLKSREPAAALGLAYDVIWRYTAPFVVKVADEMLNDLRADAERNPGRKAVFLGRDGHCLAIAVAALDPGFFEHHCAEVVLSRTLVEAAVRDVEQHLGKTFPQLREIRSVLAGRVQLDEVPGAMRRMTEYLRASGVPVGRPGSAITLVDVSYMGTLQELLSALHPETSFQGRYLFFGASPHDPHPGSKRGYALHLEADQSNGGRPIKHLPSDASLVFAHKEAILVIEETLHGPLSRADRIQGGVPVQRPHRVEEQTLRGLNPSLVSPIFSDITVREGVMDINLLAVRSYAERIARMQSGGVLWKDELSAGSERFRSQVWSWVRGEGVAPDFAQVMDSFVLRLDWRQVEALKSALRQSGVPNEKALAVWRDYNNLRAIDDKQAFVGQFVERRLERQDLGRALEP